MFKLQKIIEKYLDIEIKRLRTIPKEQLEEHQLQLVLAIEEMGRKGNKIC